MIWSLYVAGAMPTASKASRDYVVRSLERVAGEMGISQARVLAGLLREVGRRRERGETGGGGEGRVRIVEMYLPDEPERALT